jgi:hypothetical protein
MANDDNSDGWKTLPSGVRVIDQGPSDRSRAASRAQGDPSLGNEGGDRYRRDQRAAQFTPQEAQALVEKGRNVDRSIIEAENKAGAGRRIDLSKVRSPDPAKLDDWRVKLPEIPPRSAAPGDDGEDVDQVPRPDEGGDAPENSPSGRDALNARAQGDAGGDLRAWVRAARAAGRRFLKGVIK